MSRGSLIVADAIALYVTWYALRARNFATVTSPSFSGILLRDGEIECIDSSYSTKQPIQDQYTSGTPHWEACYLALAISDASRKDVVHSELFTPYFHAALST